MAATTLAALVNLIGDVLSLAIVLRVLFQILPRVDHHHPLVRIIDDVSGPILRPFRGILRTRSGIDLSPLWALIAIRLIQDLLLSLLLNPRVGVAGDLIGFAYQLVSDVLAAVIVVVLIRALLGVFHANPLNPLVRLARGVAAPLIRPFQVHPRPDDERAAVAALIVYLGLWFGLAFLVNHILLPLVIPAHFTYVG